MATRRKIEPIVSHGLETVAEIMRGKSDMFRRRGKHLEMKIDGRWRRLTEVPFDPENPSPEARAAFSQIGEDPEPEWISMREARAITGLRVDEILAIVTVKRRTTGRTHLIHLPTLRKVIAEALRSRFLSPSSTRA